MEPLSCRTPIAAGLQPTGVNTRQRSPFPRAEPGRDFDDAASAWHQRNTVSVKGPRSG